MTHDELPDYILVEKARTGDRLAFQSLFQRTHIQVWRFLRAMGLSRDEASDLTQETYVRAWEKLGQLREGTSFTSWLYQIARNQTKDWFKKKSRRPEASDECLMFTAAPSDQQPDASAERDNLLRDLERSIRQLPEHQRLPVLMHHIDGMSVTEISNSLGVSYGTVLSRLSRGRAELAKKLGHWFENDLGEHGENDAV